MLQGLPACPGNDASKRRLAGEKLRLPSTLSYLDKGECLPFQRLFCWEQNRPHLMRRTIFSPRLVTKVTLAFLSCCPRTAPLSSQKTTQPLALAVH